MIIFLGLLLLLNDLSVQIFTGTAFLTVLRKLNVKMAVQGRNHPLDVAKQEGFIGCSKASYCQILLMKRPMHAKQKSRG